MNAVLAIPSSVLPPCHKPPSVPSGLPFSQAMRPPRCAIIYTSLAQKMLNNRHSPRNAPDLAQPIDAIRRTFHA